MDGEPSESPAELRRPRRSARPLSERPSRAADFEIENHALTDLASSLAAIVSEQAGQSTGY